MRIFVTGASGFLGSFCVEQFAARGHEVSCLVRRTADLWRLDAVRDKISLIYGDLADDDEVGNALSKAKPEAVFHAAWHGVANSDRNNPAQAENIVITARLADMAARTGVAAFVGIGTQAEYGPINRTAREDTPLSPTTLYGAAKMAAADFAKRICDANGLRFAWLRVFSTYGPRDNDCWLIPSMVTTLSRGERPSLTAGEQLWDYLHARDFACAAASVIETSAEGHFNVGSGQAVPLRRIIELVRDMVDPALELGFGEVPYRPDQVMHLEADISRLQKATGWRPKIPLEDGLRETVSWFTSRKQSVPTS